MSKKNSKVTPIDAKAETKPVVSGCKVADIARAHDMNPKMVRARLRRLYRNEETRKGLPTPITAGTWTFAEKDRAAITKLVASFAGSSDAE